MGYGAKDRQSPSFAQQFGWRRAWSR